MTCNKFDQQCLPNTELLQGNETVLSVKLLSSLVINCSAVPACLLKALPKLLRLKVDKYEKNCISELCTGFSDLPLHGILMNDLLLPRLTQKNYFSDDF